jgi:hypothetical protein
MLKEYLSPSEKEVIGALWYVLCNMSYESDQIKVNEVEKVNGSEWGHETYS